MGHGQTFVFWLSSLSPTTVWYNVCINANIKKNPLGHLMRNFPITSEQVDKNVVVNLSVSKVEAEMKLLKRVEDSVEVHPLGLNCR